MTEDSLHMQVVALRAALDEAEQSLREVRVARDVSRARCDELEKERDEAARHLGNALTNHALERGALRGALERIVSENSGLHWDSGAAIVAREALGPPAVPAIISPDAESFARRFRQSGTRPSLRALLIELEARAIHEWGEGAPDLDGCRRIAGELTDRLLGAGSAEPPTGGRAER